MTLTNEQKESFKSIIIDSLKNFKEINKIILFGSFVNSTNLNDIDIAVIQNSEKENYLSLSLKYRKSLKELAKKISIDILPIKIDSHGQFMNEINQGEIIYEK